jgi:hypothetical protein
MRRWKRSSTRFDRRRGRLRGERDEVDHIPALALAERAFPHRHRCAERGTGAECRWRIPARMPIGMSPPTPTDAGALLYGVLQAASATARLGNATRFI